MLELFFHNTLGDIPLRIVADANAIISNGVKPGEAKKEVCEQPLAAFHGLLALRFD